VKEVRASLAEARDRLGRDLEAFDARLHQDFTPQAIVYRHPLLFGAVGAAVVILLIARPNLFRRGVTRVAEASVPWLLQGLLKDF
jgi:hypothetical protein